MKPVSKQFMSMPACILYSLVIPLFFFAFTLIYTALDIHPFLDMGAGRFSFNVTLLTCIVFGSVALCRLVLYFLRNVIRMNLSLLILWCIGEIVILSAFCALYLTLMLRGSQSFFSVMAFFLKYNLLVLVYPYALLILSQYLRSYLRDAVAPEEQKTLVRFLDEYKKVRLVIDRQAILFIRADENYVIIHYLDHDENKKFVLRSSMRSLEPLAERHGLVRCHRSYFINPRHIKLVRKDSEGQILAELDTVGYDPIPVSRNYYQNLSAVL